MKEMILGTAGKAGSTVMIWLPCTLFYSKARQTDTHIDAHTGIHTGTHIGTQTHRHAHESTHTQKHRESHILH